MSLITPDLRRDAIAEARRVTGTRAFQRDGDVGVLSRIEGTGPLITRSRHNSLRQTLGRRVWIDVAGEQYRDIARALEFRQ